MAPLVMKSIIGIVQSQEVSVGRATLTYTDNVYVSESILSAEHVRVKLVVYGVMYKDPKCLKDGAHILELEI